MTNGKRLSEEDLEKVSGGVLGFEDSDEDNHRDMSGAGDRNILNDDCGGDQSERAGLYCAICNYYYGMCNINTDPGKGSVKRCPICNYYTPVILK